MNIHLVFLTITVGFLSGCATVPKGTLPAAAVPKEGIYHKVNSGETLWRIAQLYHVDVQDIVRTNQIPNVAHIERNQLIFIPGTDVQKDLVVGKETTPAVEFLWPLKGKIISYFGDQHNRWINKGIDIQSEEGKIVSAAREGDVVFADYLSGYMQTVIINHQDGFLTVYSKNSKLLVKMGDHVLSGTPVAQVGTTDSLAFVHFEIRRNGIADNPLYYLP